MSKSISVIVPTRDRRQSLERCLNALDAQTCNDFEVIVVNDGAKDSTREYLESENGKTHPY
ncbi:MAG: glycosyltransferase [Planctomycetaceae bacterium]|nr:glycosyltransferase [Planctomycetaceae bacterium]